MRVVICYRECLGDPVDRKAGDCRSSDPCAPSTISERYEVRFRDECEEPPATSCQIPDIISHGKIDRRELARWVTNRRACTRLPRDPCIVLADLRVLDPDGTPHCDPDHVDISVRPILPSNVVLMELILALLEQERHEGYE